MDTPERGQQRGGTSFSRFEDSPVFNYISSLSPIKPVKSVHITQTLHSWNFSSIPSVFASPHLNTQKECRLSVSSRYPVLDLPTAEFPSDNVDDKNLSSSVSNLVKLSECVIDVQENCQIKCSLNEATVEPPEECPTLPVQTPQHLGYFGGSPNHNTAPCYGTKLDLKSVKGSLVDSVHGDQDEEGNTNVVEVEHIHLQGQTKKEVLGADWENLIADDSANLFIFDTAMESESCQDNCRKKGDHVANSFNSLSAYTSNDNSKCPQKGQSNVTLDTCLQNCTLERAGDHGGEIGEQSDSEHTPQVPPTCPNKLVISEQIEKIDAETDHHWPLSCQVNYQHHRVFRRRCLVFEVAGSNRLSDSKNNTSASLSVDIKSASGDTQQTLSKPGLGPRPHILPSIGLHLNSLATASKERISAEDESPIGRQLVSISCSTSTCSALAVVQEPPSSELVVENALCAGNEIEDLPDMQDSFEAPAIESEEINNCSPKKKKSKLENGGENEACKRCNCKKSKCLKLYCECFAAGVYCVEPCACQGCENKPIHEDKVLATRKQIESRNPLAFAPKVIRTSVPTAEIGEDTNKTPASARHKRGCNCKKSSCLKKYCECYQGGVGCSVSCRCEGCKNTFGKRDGIPPVGNEDTQHEEGQLDICEKDGANQVEIQNDPDAHKDEDHFPDNALPISPSFQICRGPVRLPIFSDGKPPHSSIVPIGSSPLLNTCHTLKKSGIAKSRFEKHFQIVPEDETPEILRGTTSPVSGVKIASPNRKRVSPPHHEIGLSPGHKCGRKLILRSIPSFPSLTNDAINAIPIKFSKPSHNS